MKITYITKYFHPSKREESVFVTRMCKQLSSMGHEISVITLQHKKFLFEEEIIDGTHVYRIPTKEKDNKKQMFDIWQFLFAHNKLITETDLIQVHDVFSWILPLKLIITPPIITTFHKNSGEFTPSPESIHQRQLAMALSRDSIAIGDYISNWYQIRPQHVHYFPSDQALQKFPDTPTILMHSDMPSSLFDITSQAIKITKEKIDANYTYMGKKKKSFDSIAKHTKASEHTVLKKSSIVISAAYSHIASALASGRYVISPYIDMMNQDSLGVYTHARHLHLYNQAESMARDLISQIKKHKISDESVSLAKEWKIKNSWVALARKYEQIWQSALLS